MLSRLSGQGAVERARDYGKFCLSTSLMDTKVRTRFQFRERRVLKGLKACSSDIPVFPKHTLTEQS